MSTIKQEPTVKNEFQASDVKRPAYIDDAKCGCDTPDEKAPTVNRVMAAISPVDRQATMNLIFEMYHDAALPNIVLRNRTTGKRVKVNTLPVERRPIMCTDLDHVLAVPDKRIALGNFAMVTNHPQDVHSRLTVLAVFADIIVNGELFSEVTANRQTGPLPNEKRVVVKTLVGHVFKETGMMVAVCTDEFDVPTASFGH